jgi:hypothetical protein
MAPDAPAPVYDSAGNVVTSWSIRLDYDPIVDEIVLHWSHPAGPYTREDRGRLSFPSDQPQQARDALLLRYSILSARRLF